MRVLAAFMFFTRLPFWKLGNPPAEDFKRVVELWPLVGWFTGILSGLIIWGAGSILPMWVAVMLAIIARLLITGALHEDGLADFLDGMGGGTTRQRILEIMKDSHIGSYGVIGLICYYLLTVGILSSLSPLTAALIVAAGDPFAKCCASQLINFLPYARTEAQAKNRTVYSRMSGSALALNLLCGIVPLVWLVPIALRTWSIALAPIAPVIVVALLIRLMRRRIGGYTGDCCGATFLLCELSFLLACAAVMR